MYTTKPNTILDLCSGLGGWTEAFVQNGWNVIRIENNPELNYVPFTQEWDVLEWQDWIDNIPHPEIIVASPPCLEFSDALSAPRTRARREGREFTPNLDLVRACLDIIDYLKPKYWILENVRGAQEDFRPLLGARRQKIGSFYLWGNFPLIITNPGFHHTKDDNDPGSSNPLRANIRAMIPFEISFALLKTLQGHTDLRRWY
jgi:hypothetical protein